MLVLNLQRILESQIMSLDIKFQVRILTLEIKTEKLQVQNNGFCGCAGYDVEDRLIDFEEFYEMMKGKI